MRARKVLKSSIVHAAAAAALLSSMALATVLIAPPAAAQAQQTRFDIPAGSLSSALAAFGRQSGFQVSYVPDIATGKTSPGVSGALSPLEAIARLLQGSGLDHSFAGRTVTVFTVSVGDGGGVTGDAVQLDTIEVSGGSAGGARPEDAPYETPATTNYISAEQMDRYRGTSPSDILKNAPGIYSGQSRASGGLDVNIRGLQGQGRVPVTVDGAQNSTALYRGYQGISNSTFVDPDFIGGVSVEKGPSMGANGAGAIGGMVNMRTLNADDIIPEGDSFGARIKIEGGTNTTSPWSERGKRGSAQPDGDRMLVFPGQEPERPGLLDMDSGSASVVLASRSENVDLVGGFARRQAGNYHAGENGGNAPKPLDCNVQGDCNVTWWSRGLTNYLPGEEVLNTSQNIYSGLLKATLRFGDDHKLDLGYTHYNSEFGEQYPTALASPRDNPYQGLPSHIELNTYTSRYRWNPQSDMIDLKWNAWASTLDDSTATTTGGYAVKESTMRGTDVSNTSRFDTAFGEVSADYGLSYLYEDTRPIDLGGSVQPREGNRSEASIFANAGWQALDWLKLDGGLRYHRFRSENTAPGNTDPEQKDDALDYAATVTVMPADGFQLYGSYKNASRLASLFEATGGFQTTVDPNLLPENSKTWEVGVNLLRDDVFTDGDSAKFKLSYFDSEIDDYINRRALSASRMHIANIARANFAGFDLSGRYDLGGFSAELGASYFTEVEYCRTLDTCQNASLASDYATNYVPPEYSVSLTLTQKLLDERLTLSGRVSHIGPRAADAETPGSGGSALLAQIPWKPYTLVDVSAAYKVSDFATLNFAIENLTDVYYVEPLSLAIMPSPGRTIRLGLTGELSATSLAAVAGKDSVDGALAHDWSGAYAGLHLAGGNAAYQMADFRQDGMYPQQYYFEGTDSYAAGVQLGYNYQLANNFVFGIDGEFSWLKADKLSQLGGRGRAETEANWLASVRGRVGYAIDNILIYGTAGYAVADLDGVYADMNRREAGQRVWTETAGGGRFDGWTVGGGVEVALSDNISLKGEYSFIDLGNGTFNPPTFYNGVDYSWDAKPRIDQIKLGVNYRF